MKEKVMDLPLGYELYKDENRQVFVKTPEGQMKFIQPIANKPVFIGLKKKTSSIEEAEKLVKQGIGKKYTTDELYRLAFPGEEEFCKAFYKMSCKMKNFIEKVYQNKGLIKKYSMIEERHSEAEKLMKDAKLIETWNNPYSPADVEVYQLSNGKYAIEFAVSYSDTFDIRTWIFKRKPSYRDFNDLLDLEEVEAKIQVYHYPEEFRCWECGSHTHFVDICANSLQERITYWDDNYCGCC